MTAEGLMAIERIKAGDLVLATSPDTYETTYKKVVETYVRETKNLIHLLIRDGNHTEKLVTTDTHPFYVSGKGFIPAAELCAGDELCTARTAGAAKSQGTGIIEKILHEVAGEPVKVYNFQVEDLHTYHVGLFGVWVHNTCQGDRSSVLKKIKEYIKKGKVKKNNIIYQIDEKTQIIFRNDTGEFAHPISSHGYNKPVNHYNIEIQTLTSAGKWKSKWSLHIILDEIGNIIDKFD